MRGSKQAAQLVGRQFGRLSVIAREANSTSNKTRWRCRCECGNEIVAFACNLLKPGHTRSCGCLLRDLAVDHKPSLKHGESKDGTRMDANISIVGVDEQSLRESTEPQVAQLRRPRHHGVRAMAHLVRDVPRRHGAAASRHIDRSYQRGRQLRTGELQVGDSKRAAAQQATEESPVIRWDTPQEPFDWEAFKRAMFEQLKHPPQPRPVPMRASLYYALQRRRLRAACYDALGLRR